MTIGFRVETLHMVIPLKRGIMNIINSEVAEIEENTSKTSQKGVEKDYDDDDDKAEKRRRYFVF